jgi:tetratricopeptide (TPR) repeat protein
MFRRAFFLLILATGALAQQSDLERAQSLAWSKQFEEAEALYRTILARTPRNRAAQLGLAQVVLWRGRYAEAIERFNAILREQPDNQDALEGRANAAYWRGDWRSAARDFRRVNRDGARRSLQEIEAATRPWQRADVAYVDDDQPLDHLRAETTAAFYSDPLTRWSASIGGYQLDAARRGESSGQYVAIENATSFVDVQAGARLGLFEFPDGVRRPIGSASVRYRDFTARIDRREELATATAIATHATSTTTTLQWRRERNWIAALEASHKRYFDDNSGTAAIAYAVAPVFKRGAWTLWTGASAAARDTDESRFIVSSVSSTREGNAFRYRYRGEYAPYWTPDDLFEVRAVVALERRTDRGTIKLHADAGVARDRGRGFGPDLGSTPFPSPVFAFDFGRDYNPWRAGASADLRVTSQLRLEVGVERSVTIDYRSNSLHAALVRRR